MENLSPVFDLDAGDALKVTFIIGNNFHASDDRGYGDQDVSIHNQVAAIFQMSINVSGFNDRGVCEWQDCADGAKPIEVFELFEGVFGFEAA